MLLFCTESVRAATRISEGEQEILWQAVQRARGIYAEPRAACFGDEICAADAVLVVSFNKGYTAFFNNWACHANRLGLKYLVWPMGRFQLQPDLRHATVFTSAMTDGSIETDGPMSIKDENLTDSPQRSSW